MTGGVIRPGLPHVPVVLYSTANDPETANDPKNGPQMILDRK